MWEPKLIDLRPICRKTDRECSVNVRFRGHVYPWLRLGEVSLIAPDSRHAVQKWDLKAYLGDPNPEHSVPTDREHDSSHACVLSLIGVVVQYISSYHVSLEGFIEATDFNSFRVPDETYQPLEGKGPEDLCPQPGCADLDLEFGGGPHYFTDYLPPQSDATREMFHHLRGCPVEISIFSPENQL